MLCKKSNARRYESKRNKIRKRKTGTETKTIQHSTSAAERALICSLYKQAVFNTFQSDKQARCKNIWFLNPRQNLQRFLHEIVQCPYTRWADESLKSRQINHANIMRGCLLP